MTRDEILAALRKEHANLLTAMAGVSDDVMATQPIVDKWTLKDLMGHVAMWEQVATKFIAEFKQDGLPRSVGIKDDAALNAYNERGWALRRDWPPARVRAEWDAAFGDLVAAVESSSDTQLNAPLPAPLERRYNVGTTDCHQLV